MSSDTPRSAEEYDLAGEIIATAIGAIRPEGLDALDAILKSHNRAVDALSAMKAERDELHGTLYALLAVVWRSFDAGGESMRSQRSQALEAATSLLCGAEGPGSFVEKVRRMTDDPWAFIAAARLSSPLPDLPAPPSGGETTNG